MAIQMTRAEYEKKYGVKPDFSSAQTTQPSSNPLGGIGSTIKGAAQSGVGMMKDAFAESQAGKNPLETGAKLGAGAIQTVFSPLAPLTAPISKGVEFAADKISDNPSVQKFAQSKTGQVVARGAENAANLSTIAGAVMGPKAAVRSVSNVAAKTTGAFDDLSASLKTTARQQAGSQPAKIMQRVARVSKGKQAKFEGMAGESIGDYLTKRGIYGNVDEISGKLYERFNKSKDVADGALAELSGTYNPPAIKTALKELLDRETRVSTEGAPSQILSRVEELNAKLEKQGLTMSEINEAKRFYEKNVRVDYLKQNLPESVARANNIDSAIRTWQLKQANTLGLKNLDKINKETQLSRQLLDDLGQEYSGSAGNNAMTLTDWIMLSGGDPSAIAGFLVKKGFSSKGVQSAIAEALNKNKPVMGNIRAEMGPSEVPRLNAPTSQFRSQTSGSTPIKIAPKGANMEITGKGGINSSKPQPRQSLEKSLESSGDTTSKIRNSQGGYVNFSAIAKSMDNFDADKMTAFVDLVNRGKTPSKEILAGAQKVADAMNLESRFGTNGAMAKDFTSILDVRRKINKKLMK